MSYDTKLADRIGEYLSKIPAIKIEEKKMFSGMTFMIDDKMCISVSGERLMCRFDPLLQDELSNRPGFQTMVMKGKHLKGYCYVSPEVIKEKKDFEFWLNVCLDFNKKARSSKRQKKTQ